MHPISHKPPRHFRPSTSYNTARQGWILQTEQLTVPGAAAPAALLPDSGHRVVTGARFKVCRSTGALLSLSVPKLGELLAAPLTPCFYRAPTDNDRGGSGGTSFLAQWRRAGLDKLVCDPGSLVVEGGEEEGAVEVSYRLVPGADYAATGGDLATGVGVGETGGTHWLSMSAEGAGDDASASEKGSSVASPADPARPFAACIHVHARYELDPDGALSCRFAFDTRQALPGIAAALASLPRVGVRLGVPRAMRHVSWFGLGPHECYPDRKASALLGVFARQGGTLDKSYIRPSARWLVVD